ncbi:hypothetical protein WMY93_001874 [Mugilogobius chulae]|uniref:Rubicon Homology domain-containing protein n=1 Tax=Mugilogobius chulae TaxID=88201 RepID=A0AAW0PT83_9GOBI
MVPYQRASEMLGELTALVRLITSHTSVCPGCFYPSARRRSGLDKDHLLEPRRCQRPVGLSRGKAKVCFYSGWYYCSSCHQDQTFLIPARLLHNWDTSRHKVGLCSTDCTDQRGFIGEKGNDKDLTQVSKQAKEFLEFVYEEPLLDVQRLNPCLYDHSEALSSVLRLRQQLQSLRAYLFNCRATVAEDLRRRYSPNKHALNTSGNQHL